MGRDIGAEFRDLHRRGDPFILANAWDLGSARLLESLGAKAIATSSAAHAFTLGRPDTNLTRDEALAHAESLVGAVNVPVSGDLENGFADDPDGCAETVRLAVECGLAGISIEDTLQGGGSYDRELAVQRIRAACSAARAAKRDFVLVARADGILQGNYGVDEALARFMAFEEAGADCLYAPLPSTWEDQLRLIGSTKLPVNVLIAGPYAQRPLSEYAKAGAARLSLGSSLARLTHRVVHDAAKSMFVEGDFSPLADGIDSSLIDSLISR